MKYIKQLDSLRAIAVLLVILSHWNWAPSIHFVEKLFLGNIGVDIFFVLSGFLISKILFEQRLKLLNSESDKNKLIKNFYFRRALRIFPIYYITIFLLLIFSSYTDTNIRDSFLYFLTYTSNFYFFKIGSFDGMVSHLWSLSVEEQFYLIWPWLILFPRKKYLLYIISSFIILGVVSQYITSDYPLSDVITINCFDSFGFGALLSWFVSYKKNYLNKFYNYLSKVTCFVLLLLTIYYIFHILLLPYRTMVSIIALWIITYIYLMEESENKVYFLKQVLDSKLMILIGKMSYGIYIYHLIIPYITSYLLIKLNNFTELDYTKSSYWWPLFYFVNTIFLFIVSWLSYIAIEKKFLNLKKYFNY